MSFRVALIDHVELHVPDRQDAAAWYEERLGLEVAEEFSDWAESGGPLMIGTPDGETRLALFAGEPQGNHAIFGFRRVAFRVDGDGFLRFLDSLSEIHVPSRDGGRLSADEVVDHDQAWSIYFQDPWGNRLELITHDHERVAAALDSSA